MTLSNLGYISLSLSKDLSSAIISLKVVYLGGCYLPLLYFFTVCEICHVRLKKRMIFLLISLQSILYFFVCTIGYSSFYYKSVEFSIVNNAVHLIKQYGFMHTFHPFSMFCFFVASVTILIIYSTKKKAINHKEIRNMIICAAIAIGCYLTQTILHFSIDILPIAYIILISGALVPIYHSNIFTVDENKDIVYEQLNKVGFITFNSRMKYMGANDFALNIFKELRDCEIGNEITTNNIGLQTIINNTERFRKEISEKSGHRHVRNKKIPIGKRIYDTEIHTLNNYRRKCIGYTVEFRDETEHYHVLDLTEKYTDILTKEVEAKTEKIISIQQKTILGMAQLVESRDLSTGGHIKRTSDVVKIFSKKLLEQNAGFSKHFLELVIRSAPMHDLGKIGVDDAVLRKQSRFTDEEYEKMKKHAEIGGKMVRDILTNVEEDEFVRIAFNVANYHHEKVNGKGYPCGLVGNKIPIEARIMALADVFDALVSKRCYKEAFTYEEAFSIIKKDAGQHFDAKLAEIFLKCRQELEDYYNNTNV